MLGTGTGSGARTVRWVSLAIATAAVLPLLAGCQSPTPDIAPTPAVPHFDYPVYDTLQELTQASDTVVRGHVTEIRRVYVGPDPDIHESLFSVAVDEWLAGEGPDEVDVLLMTGIDGRLFEGTELEGRPTPAVGDEGVWFLRRIRPKYDVEGFVLTSFQGLILRAGGGGIVGAGADELPLYGKVHALGTFDAVLDRLRALDSTAGG